MTLNGCKNADKCSRLPFMACTRYSKCSVNNCPLSSDYPNGYIDQRDPEQKCTLPKSYRLKVAAQSPGVLRYSGLTKREFTGSKAWNNLSNEEKSKRKASAKNFLKCRGFQKDVPEQVQTKGQDAIVFESQGKSNQVDKKTGFLGIPKKGGCSI